MKPTRENKQNPEKRDQKEKGGKPEPETAAMVTFYYIHLSTSFWKRYTVVALTKARGKGCNVRRERRIPTRAQFNHSAVIRECRKRCEVGITERKNYKELKSRESKKKKRGRREDIFGDSNGRLRGDLCPQS